MPDADAITDIYADSAPHSDRDTFRDAARHAIARGYSQPYAIGYARAYSYRDGDGYANGYRDGFTDRNAGRDLDPNGDRVIHTDRLPDVDTDTDGNEHGGPDFDTNADSRAYDDQRYADADAAAHHHAEEYAGPSD